MVGHQSERDKGQCRPSPCQDYKLAVSFRGCLSRRPRLFAGAATLVGYRKGLPSHQRPTGAAIQRRLAQSRSVASPRRRRIIPLRVSLRRQRGRIGRIFRGEPARYPHSNRTRKRDNSAPDPSHGRARRKSRGDRALRKSQGSPQPFPRERARRAHSTQASWPGPDHKQQEREAGRHDDGDGDGGLPAYILRARHRPHSFIRVAMLTGLFAGRVVADVWPGIGNLSSNH